MADCPARGANYDIIQVYEGALVMRCKASVRRSPYERDQCSRKAEVQGYCKQHARKYGVADESLDVTIYTIVYDVQGVPSLLPVPVLHETPRYYYVDSRHDRHFGYCNRVPKSYAYTTAEQAIEAALSEVIKNVERHEKEIARCKRSLTLLLELRRGGGTSVENAKE